MAQLKPQTDELEDSSDQDDDYDGSLEGESEDEWAEERRAMRYVAESELEDDIDSTSEDESVDVPSNPTVTSKFQSIGSLLKTSKPRENSRNNKSDLLGSSDLKSHSKRKMNGRTLPAPKNSSEDEGLANASRKRTLTRSNKHAPIEISSKKPVTRKREIVQAPKIERRDPRFDPLSGGVNEDLVRRSYGFLTAQRKAEIEQKREKLNKAIKKGQDLEALEQLQVELKREENREVQREKIEREKDALRKWKAIEKEKRKEGKGAFFLKRKAKKEIVLADRYEHLSKDKLKLHKSIDRKRKKVDGKEKKSMPIKRNRRLD